MRPQECERRPAALDLRFEVGVAADALAVADAGLVDAQQDEGHLRRHARKELVDSRRRALRALDRVAAQPRNEQDGGAAIRRSLRPRENGSLERTLRITDRRVDDLDAGKAL